MHSKRFLFSWVFLDFNGFAVPKDTLCSYPNYDAAKDALDDFITNHGKFKVIQEFKVDDLNSQINKIKVTNSPI